MTIANGTHIYFVDENGICHDALVNQVWNNVTHYTKDDDPNENPGVNLVYIQHDKKYQDQYGQQIARATSVVHRKYQAANGMYWMRIEERK